METIDYTYTEINPARLCGPASIADWAELILPGDGPVLAEATVGGGSWMLYGDPVRGRWLVLDGRTLTTATPDRTSLVLNVVSVLRDGTVLPLNLPDSAWLDAREAAAVLWSLIDEGAARPSATPATGDDGMDLVLAG